MKIKYISYRAIIKNNKLYIYIMDENSDRSH